MSLDKVLLLLGIGVFFYLFIKSIFKNKILPIKELKNSKKTEFSKHIDFVIKSNDLFIKAIILNSEYLSEMEEFEPELLDLILHEAEFRKAELENLKSLSERPEGLK